MYLSYRNGLGKNAYVFNERAIDRKTLKHLSYSEDEANSYSNDDMLDFWPVFLFLSVVIVVCTIPGFFLGSPLVSIIGLAVAALVWTPCIPATIASQRPHKQRRAIEKANNRTTMVTPKSSYAFAALLGSKDFGDELQGILYNNKVDGSKAYNQYRKTGSTNGSNADEYAVIAPILNRFLGATMNKDRTYAATKDLASPEKVASLRKELDEYAVYAAQRMQEALKEFRGKSSVEMEQSKELDRFTADAEIESAQFVGLKEIEPL